MPLTVRITVIYSTYHLGTCCPAWRDTKCLPLPHHFGEVRVKEGGLPGGGVLSLMSRIWSRERQGGSSQQRRQHTPRGNLLYLH